MTTTTSKNRLNVTELDFDQVRANLKTFIHQWCSTDTIRRL